MKRKAKFRLWLALIIWVISISLFLWASWPVSRHTQLLPLPTIEIPLPTPTALLNSIGWMG